MSPLRIILVGLGARAQFWMRVIRDNPDCTIVGLVDPSEAARNRALEQWPGAIAAADVSLLGQIEADAVLLATPPGGREAQMEAACAAGLPILAEKPLADGVELAARYVEMAEAAGVPLMVGLNFRFLPVTQHAMRLMDETVGAPEFARFTYERWRDGWKPNFNKYPLTMDQPMLWEQSIHHFDLMRYVYKSEPVQVFGKTFNPSWSMYRDDANVSALITFANGITVNYQGLWQSNWQAPGFQWRSECAKGVVIQNDQFGDLNYALHGDAALTSVLLPSYEQWINDAVALLAAFVAALRGTAPLLCSGRDHLSSLRMVQACILSSQLGQAINPADLDFGAKREIGNPSNPTALQQRTSL
ncbi:Gfo/Idh/MocA family protein [Devosia psychrophila]|jgi:predicted dehydrogenase|uniref:Predicted dehydrogenase n=1 Tax=Devosia psychrophila TaxID=728005 RepID=A0A1I1Q056_9HYPH|nr:Gfo/Idh/MocA family oxidoreductase [Devosia psychrophila]SFD15302.1 Predicted dehydrogenase [Devosia psychrophila]